MIAIWLGSLLCLLIGGVLLGYGMSQSSSRTSYTGIALVCVYIAISASRILSRIVA